MILNVSVTEYRHSITAQEVGLTRDTQTVSRLREQYVPSWFSAPTRSQWQADLDSTPGFQWYVDKYSEVVTSEPWSDVELFFQRLAAVGRRTAHGRNLYYPGRDPLLNTAAMAYSAEALAGWYCEESYNWDLITRPQRVSTDIVFLDQSGRWALVEVKSTGRSGSVRGKMTTEMIKLLRILAATKLLRPDLYYVVLMMVQVVGPTDIRLTNLVLEEV